MSSMSIGSMVLFALSFVCALAASWALLIPFFRDQAERETLDLRAKDIELTDLLARKERTLQSIEELEQDQRTGKITPEGYQSSRDELTRAAGECLARIDSLSAESKKKKQQ